MDRDRTALQPILTFAHTLLEHTIQPGDIVIDCTMGNGHDTLFLANLVGQSGHVFAFDIQESAIAMTKKRLEQNGVTAERVTLIQASHGDLLEHIPANTDLKCKAVIFNLGYLPGGDKQICTTPDTTIAAIETLRTILAPGGLIVLVVYPGHTEGATEAATLLQYCETIPHTAVNVVLYRILNNPNRPPFVIALEMKG
ncbi:MAG: methyltransferase domain-containing protein [Oscillospiraceae bacterium]|nr:methyltransferase domain-containing protein [Oscillospiraceae bacterium]